MRPKSWLFSRIFIGGFDNVLRRLLLDDVLNDVNNLNHWAVLRPDLYQVHLMWMRRQVFHNHTVLLKYLISRQFSFVYQRPCIWKLPVFYCFVVNAHEILLLRLIGILSNLLLIHRSTLFPKKIQRNCFSI